MFSLKSLVVYCILIFEIFRTFIHVLFNSAIDTCSHADIYILDDGMLLCDTDTFVITLYWAKFLF